MTPKKIFILLGHPDKDTCSGFFVDQYEAGAREAGHEVKRLNIDDLDFDPILHKGYKVMQALEPDLLKVQENVKWCNHFVIFYPSWWSSMPALLKGLFDRVWLPNFAYRFRHGLGWKRLLTGRSARVFVTSDSHPFIARLLFGDSTNEIKRGILAFSGFWPVRIKKIGPMKDLKPARRERWGQMLKEMGKKGV